MDPIATAPSGTEANAAGFAFRSAFVETAADRAALPAEALIQIAFDIPRAIEMALATVTRIIPLMAAIAELPVEHALIERLEAYTLAAAYAHARYRRAVPSREALEAVHAEAVKRRARLYSDASNLIQHELLHAGCLDKLKNRAGFLNVGYELMALVDLLRSAPHVAGRMATLPDELDRAEQVASELIGLVAARTKPNRGAERARAISLMVNAYEEVRRAVQFLRYRKGDADRFAPSLYSAKQRRRKPVEVRDEVVEAATDTLATQVNAVMQVRTETTRSPAARSPRVQTPHVPSDGTPHTQNLLPAHERVAAEPDLL